MKCTNLIALALSSTLFVACAPGEPGVGQAGGPDSNRFHEPGDPQEIHTAAEARSVANALSSVALGVLAKADLQSTSPTQTVPGVSGNAIIAGTLGPDADVMITFEHYQVHFGSSTITLQGELSYRRATVASNVELSLAAAELDVDWSVGTGISDTVTVDAYTTSAQNTFSGSLTSSSGVTFTF